MLTYRQIYLSAMKILASEADAYELNKLYDQWKQQQQSAQGPSQNTQGPSQSTQLPDIGTGGTFGILVPYPPIEWPKDLPTGCQIPSCSLTSEADKVNKWKSEGKCTQCGELGAFINLGMTCSKHGSY